MPRTVEQQAAFERLKAFEEEMKASEQIDFHMHSNSQRWSTTYTLTGDRKVVSGVAKKMIESDTCTPCYEHMLMRLASVKELPRERIEVVLTKSHYAGD